MSTVYTYLVSDVGDVSCELSIRGKLSHMLNNLKVPSSYPTLGNRIQLHNYLSIITLLHSLVIKNTVCILVTVELTLLNAIMRLEVVLLS